ncbi:unnamed protein product, partial [Anisakis simplex]|uniref:Trithorax group protein osa n=1 Tax=Anisakis simplex TaxID=6269 RepID=A0A0M3J4I6_ANISI
MLRSITFQMAKAPPAQRYRLQALRQHTESSSASDAGGTDTKLGPLEVDTSDMSAVASTSKSPLDSNNTVRKSSSGSVSSATKSPSGARHPVTKSPIGSATSGSSHSPKDAGSAHLNVRRRVSEPATSGAHGTTNRDGRNHHSQDDRPAASVTHHKSVACPELEYRSPLARTYPNQTSPSSTQKFDDVRLSSSSFGRRPITTIDRSQHHRRFTDHDTEGGGQSTGSRFRHNSDVGKGSSGWNDRRSSFEDQLAGGEPNRGGGGGGGSGWHMPSQPPPWVPRNRRDHDSFRHPIPTIGSSISPMASSSHQPYRYPPPPPNHHSRYPPPSQRGSQFNRRFENNRYPAPPPHYNTTTSSTGGFNPSQKAPPLLPRPPFPPAPHHAHSSSSPSSSSASQPFDANAPHQTMQGTQEECVQYTEPSQQEPIPMDIEESPMNEDENEHLRQQQSNSSDTQSQPQKSSTV